MATENDETPRKRGPRSPALSLKDALDRALRIYEKEGRHSVPTDVAAQDIGYKDGSSGPARTALATLKQFGLAITPKEGHFAVARPVETFKFAPDEPTRTSLLLEFLRTPPFYRSLLTKYEDRLPSDGALKFDFINFGFLPSNVDDDVKTFKNSVEFAKFYDYAGQGTPGSTESIAPPAISSEPLIPSVVVSDVAHVESLAGARADRIPIRLSGGRKAVLEVPVPFYEADKRIIKAQVDLILADDPATASNSEVTASE